MAEYIEREVAITTIQNIQGPILSKEVSALRRLSAADVVEVKHGEWLARARKNGVGKCCSVCMGVCAFAPVPYCPNCGAKMKG